MDNKIAITNGAIKEIEAGGQAAPVLGKAVWLDDFLYLGMDPRFWVLVSQKLSQHPDFVARELGEMITGLAENAVRIR